MVLESILICLDNSEFMRNGDYSPSRFDAQFDTINAIASAHIRDSPENTVGILSTAGDRVQVVVTLTTDLGAIVTGLHGVKVGGVSNFVEGLQVAQLALKHRPNKRHDRRIIMFVGSPVEETEKDLKRLGARLKKNGVAVDIISFGENDGNDEKLSVFVDAVNNRDNSHFLSVPSGSSLQRFVSDSEIVNAGNAGGDFGYGGIDPNVDPELAAAIAASMADIPQDQDDGDAPMGDLDFGDDMDPDVLRAIQLSMMDMGAFEEQVNDDVEMGDAENDATPEPTQEPEASHIAQTDDVTMQDDELDGDFMSGLLSTLPGVDVNDPSIQDFLTTFNQGENKEEDDE